MRLRAAFMVMAATLLSGVAQATDVTPSTPAPAPVPAPTSVPTAAPSQNPAPTPTVQPPPTPTVAPTAPPAAAPARIAPELITSDGYPRTLHLQLTTNLKQAYVVRVVSGGSTLTCPIPLSPTTGCDLRPIKDGDAKYTVLEGSQEVATGVISIPSMGGTLKLTREPEEWVKRIGYSLITLGGFGLVAGGGLWGIDHYCPDDNAAQVTMAISIPIIVAGILLVVLPRTPELRQLASDEVLIPAPPPPAGGN